MTGPPGPPAAFPAGGIMVDEAADHTSVDENDSSHTFYSPLLPPPSPNSFPKSLTIAVWNRRGGHLDKLDWFNFLISASECDFSLSTKP